VKSTFNGLQFCCTDYRTIFIRLTIVASQTSKTAKSCKIPTKFDLIAVQVHQMSLILVSIESSYATSY